MNDLVRQHSPATARNRAPILAVLKRVLPVEARVLEIASGSGEHAVFLAARLAIAAWLPSDPSASARASIAAWTEAEGASAVLPPRAIDVCSPLWGVEAEAPFDAIVCINMIHISPWRAALGLMAGAGRLLRESGVLYTYGPYKRGGRHTAPSNEAFDEWLKAQDPEYGVRDVAEVEAAAAAHGLALREIVEMPANNLSLVFAR